MLTEVRYEYIGERSLWRIEAQGSGISLRILRDYLEEAYGGTTRPATYRDLEEELAHLTFEVWREPLITPEDLHTLINLFLERVERLERTELPSQDITPQVSRSISQETVQNMQINSSNWESLLSLLFSPLISKEDPSLRLVEIGGLYVLRPGETLTVDDVVSAQPMTGPISSGFLRMEHRREPSTGIYGCPNGCNIRYNTPRPGGYLCPVCGYEYSGLEQLGDDDSPQYERSEINED